MNRKPALAFAAVLALSLAVSAPAQFGKPSKQQQVQLGLRAANELRSKEKVLPSYDDRVKTLRRVANRLLGTVDDQGQPWQYSFDVIQSKDVNAFALPGGPTFF